ncbi:MAG TPA: NlpC/P60 family protein [Puia sp.]|nr:NlpC/P60 family protein [Puia sp.]
MKLASLTLLAGLFVLGCDSMRPVASDQAVVTYPVGKHDAVLPTKVPPGGNYANSGKIGPEVINASYNGDHANHGFAKIESYSPLRFKYAILLDVPIEVMSNERLLQFVDEWYGAKYHFGGSTREGVDCSAFVSTLMSSVYGITSLPRVSKDQFLSTTRIAKKNLREGDLVFFHTYGKRRSSVTHVGVYLHNSKFVHASISGVMISDMAEGYYQIHYIGGGRAFALSVASTK